jgi:hypothetical protein
LPQFSCLCKFSCGIRAALFPVHKQYPSSTSRLRSASGPGPSSVPPGAVPARQARSRGRAHLPPAATCNASGYRPRPGSARVARPIRRCEAPPGLPARPNRSTPRWLRHPQTS